MMVLNANIAAMHHAASGNSGGCTAPVPVGLVLIALWVLLISILYLIAFVMKRRGVEEADDMRKEGFLLITKLMAGIFLFVEVILCSCAALGLIPWIGI